MSQDDVPAQPPSPRAKENRDLLASVVLGVLAGAGGVFLLVVVLILVRRVLP